jgi:hypothetical protein
VIAAIYYVWSWRDTKVHGGITAARRRRTMKSGRIAEATVLSSKILPGATLDANTTARSIVYEVSVPEGSALAQVSQDHRSDQRSSSIALAVRLSHSAARRSQRCPSS